jgi:hypothetical protein
VALLNRERVSKPEDIIVYGIGFVDKCLSLADGILLYQQRVFLVCGDFSKIKNVARKSTCPSMTWRSLTTIPYSTLSGCAAGCGTVI